MLTEVRASLLEEARRSPTLLSDLAGLEAYVAESYNARAFIELLQNADDAGASRLIVWATRSHLLVANDGRPFTQEDFESLCRSAASRKARGASIGYRGIGFKSVVGLAGTVHLLSDTLEVTFSRERTRADLPEAARVPLVRVPHPLLEGERNTFALELAALRAEGFSTVFVFAHLVPHTVGVEFEQFDASTLLFLRSVDQVELRGEETRLFKAERHLENSTEHVTVEAGATRTDWILQRQEDLAIAWASEAGRPVAVPEAQAVAHAFLPTAEPTGFGFKLNGDLSTDPSRTKVILDDATRTVLDRLATWLVHLWRDALLGEGSEGERVALFRACLPPTDPRTYAYGRPSLRRELAALIATYATAAFSDVVMPPAWISAHDGVELAQAAGYPVVGASFTEIPGATAFLRFLGIREVSLEELLRGATETLPGALGALDLVARTVTAQQTAQLRPEAQTLDVKMWTVADGRRSLRELQARPVPLDMIFLEGLVERGIPADHTRAFLSKVAGLDLAHQLLPPESPPTANVASRPESASRSATPTFSLKRWRGAEQQAQAYFEALGWRVRDVSRQNVGYDLHAEDKEGNTWCVEVKSIDAPGQAFALTSNEEAVARERGEAYLLVLVRQTSDVLEVNVIRQPLEAMTLTRQCRQWVWECTEYPYAPVKVPLID